MGKRRWDLPSPPTPLQTTTLQSPPSTQTTFDLSPSSSSSSSPTTQTTTLTIPPSSSISSSSNPQPLTTPRLHLRTLLPSPPLPDPYLDTVPGIPSPWIWRCHLCSSIYRLGVTRRCSQDGHLFCSVESPPPSPIRAPDPPPNSATNTDEVKGREESDNGNFRETRKSNSNGNSRSTPGVKAWDRGGLEGDTMNGEGIPLERAALMIKRARKANQKRTRQKRRVAARGCIAEFDYSGWSGFNTWGREKRNAKKVRRMRRQMRTAESLIASAGTEDRRSSEKYEFGSDVEETQTQIPRWNDHTNNGLMRCGGEELMQGELVMPKMRSRILRDCYRGCEFPSECHNERKEEREWEARIRAMRKVDEGKSGRRRESGLESEEVEAGEIEVDVEGGVSNVEGGGDRERGGEMGMSGVSQVQETDPDTDAATDVEMDIESEADAEEDSWDLYSDNPPSTSSKTSSHLKSVPHSQSLASSCPAPTQAARIPGLTIITQLPTIAFTSPLIPPHHHHPRQKK